jgi:hypothetical protein
MIPADSRVEIDAKIAAGYFTNGNVMTMDELSNVTGRAWEDVDVRVYIFVYDISLTIFLALIVARVSYFQISSLSPVQNRERNMHACGVYHFWLTDLQYTCMESSHLSASCWRRNIGLFPLEIQLDSLDFHKVLSLSFLFHTIVHIDVSSGNTTSSPIRVAFIKCHCFSSSATPQALESIVYLHVGRATFFNSGSLRELPAWAGDLP